MAKVHPKASGAAARAAVGEEEERERPATVLTVWRKSLLFNCDGFTVYDSATGDLAFRVDSYGTSSARRRSEDVVLMDAAGKPLLTVRRKARLLLGPAHWVIYEGDAAAAGSGSGSAKPLLSVRRRRRGGASDKAVADVTRLAAGAEAGDYVVEGSYGRRSLAVRDAAARGGAVVAEVRRKESVGDDVFRLVVPAGGAMGAAAAMGVVIALDQMFPGGSSSSSPRSLLPRSWSA